MIRKLNGNANIGILTKKLRKGYLVLSGEISVLRELAKLIFLRNCKSLINSQSSVFREEKKIPYFAK